MTKPRLSVSAVLAFSLCIFLPALTVAREQPPASASSAGSAVSDKDALNRANSLLAKMTLEEKIGQISQRFDIASLFPTGTPAIPGMPPMTPLDDVVRKGEIGAVLFVHDPEVAKRFDEVEPGIIKVA